MNSLTGRFHLGQVGRLLVSATTVSFRSLYQWAKSKNLGQVVLANFRNRKGLQPLGNNVWMATSMSGSVLEGTPGSSGQYGPIQSAALED